MTLLPEEVRAFRIERQREFYRQRKNFIHYVRDFGVAPDAEWEPHGRGAKHILSWRKTKQMVLWPRGSFKSHVFDAGLVSWEICCDPNIRILIASETYKQAATHAGLAKHTLESPKHVEVWGVHEQRVGWTQGEFTTRQRTNMGLKEPTVTATGIDQVRTGMHYDLVIMDDIVSQENTRTPEAIEQVNTWFGETLAQLDPGCRLLMIGTRHHFFDQYGRLLKDPDLRDLFEISINQWQNENGTLFFPARLTERYVMEQKLLLGPKLWSAYYLNAPQSDEDQLFKPEQFHVVNADSVPRNCFATLLTDFAAGENKDNDRTCLLVVALNYYRDAFVLDAQIGRWLPDQAVCNALLLYQKWQHRFLKGMTIERTTHTEWAKAAIQKWANKLSVRPNLIEIEGRSKETKYRRIQAMQPRFEEGSRLFWSSELLEDRRQWDLIVREITEFPFSQHDDIPDCLSDVDAMRARGGFYVPSPPPGFNPAKIPGMQRWRPSLIDGRYNPAKVEELDLSQLLKGVAQSAREGDLWSEIGQKSNCRERIQERETPFL